jgi:hypothetical protein
MNPESKMMIEQAKNLALTISLLNDRYDKLVGEFNSKLSEVYLRLNSDVKDTKKTLEFISENVAYKANLDETQLHLNTFVNDINANLLNYATLHDHPYALDTHNHDEEYSKLGHEHDYVPNNEFDSYRIQSDKKQNSLSAYTIDSVQSICTQVKDNFETLISQIESTNGNLESITDRLATSIDDVEHKLDIFKSNTKKDLNDLLEIIDGIKNKLTKDLAKTFKDVNDKFDKEIDKIYTNIDKNLTKTNNAIDAVESKLIDNLNDLADDINVLNVKSENQQSQIDSLSAGKSDKDHTHEDILTSIDVLQETQESLSDSIDTIFGKLKDKPEYSEILLKADLDKLKQEIIDAVPVPKDGKDAEEWEFKPHPTRKGILIFKKKSQKSWNYIDLNHITPKLHDYDQQGFGYLSGGGAGGGSSGIAVLWNNNISSTSSSIINFTGTAVTSVVENDGRVTVVLDKGDGESEPDLLNPEFTYNENSQLSRVDYDDGSYKVFTYDEDQKLIQSDFVSNGITKRKTFIYDGDVLNRVEQTTI